MYHFFVEPHQIGAEEIRIEGADVNHIRNVLRMKPGEEILISSREGGDYFCRVEELEPELVFRMPSADSYGRRTISYPAASLTASL